jgi:hypothetical protein
MRFYQPDPDSGSYDLTDPQSFNRYSYVQNDPVNSIDPSGLCTFNINISGASGKILSEIQNELRRIFQTGGQNVVFNHLGRVDGVSVNLSIVDAFTGRVADFISQQGVNPYYGAEGATPTRGDSYVYQPRIYSDTEGVRTIGPMASLGTMVGRVSAHEVIQHSLLGIPREGVGHDITNSGASKEELATGITTRFNIAYPSTGALLESLCQRRQSQSSNVGGGGVGDAFPNWDRFFARDGNSWLPFDAWLLLNGQFVFPPRRSRAV